MPNYRVSYIMGGGAMGDSETFVTANITAETCASQVNTVTQLRKRLLPTDCYFQGIRIGQWSPVGGGLATQRRSQLFPPGNVLWPEAGVSISVPQAGNFTPTGGLSAESQFRSVLQLRTTFDTNRTTTRYLSGVSSAAFVGQSGKYVGPAGESAWDQALTNWAKQISTFAWGIIALDRTTANPAYHIQFIRQEPVATNPRLGLIFLENAPAWTGGTRLQLQKFRPPKGTRNGTLNGTWYLDARSDTDFPGTTVFYLRSSQNITPQMVAFTDKTVVYKYAQVYYPINLLFALKEGVKKRGRPTTSPHGRALKRPTLDP